MYRLYIHDLPHVPPPSFLVFVLVFLVFRFVPFHLHKHYRILFVGNAGCLVMIRYIAEVAPCFILV